MKKLIALLTVAFLFTMCNINKKADLELQVKNDSLERLVNDKDSAIYAIIGTFNEIEENLQAIKDKENIIASTATNVEDQRTREQKINEDINLIYDLMQENREKVAQLRYQLKKANIKNSDLQNTIANLQTKLAEKNAEILELRKNLMNMNLKIDELTYSLDTMVMDIEVKSSIIKEQDISLNKAYYLFGSQKELKQMEVLNKKGGFIGIGAGKNINQNFNKEYFTEIDIRVENVFEFDHAKKIKIITTHPSNSYTIYGEKPIDSLVINNTEEFWSVSKYLLIVLN